MVVNSIIMAMVTHANKSSQIIFHVGSSLRNPMKLPSLSDLISLYFTQNPWIDRNGKSIKVSKLIVFSNIATFQAYMAIRYKLPLKVFGHQTLLIIFSGILLLQQKENIAFPFKGSCESVSTMHEISQRKRPLNLCVLRTITIISLFFFPGFIF